MELQQVRYVVAVAEERNFTRAAQRCHVVQSALSHQVKALERELGVELFARTSRRVELTSAGAAFLPQARAMLESAQRARADAAAATGEIRGTLTVGVIPTVTSLNMPHALGDFHRAHPQVRISLRVGSSDDFVGHLKEGLMDVAVLGLPEGPAPSGVSTRVLSRDRHVAVVPARHRLAKRRRVRLDELAEHPFADFPSGSPGRAQTDLAFRAANIHREVAFEVMGVDLMLDLVRQGLVVALLPRAIVPASDELVVISVTGGPTRVERLAWSDFNPSPAAMSFLDLLLT